MSFFFLTYDRNLHDVYDKQNANVSLYNMSLNVSSDTLETSRWHLLSGAN